MLELATRQPQLELDAALGKMQVERHQRIAALLDLADEPADLLGMHEQLAGAGRIGREVRGHRRQRTDVCADQKQLFALDDDVALADLRPAAADRLDLPAFERDACLVALLDEVIVERLAVLHDGHEEF
jgi:hypothetical protein